ncbi:LysR family transcriptional regulator [Paracoccus xiamenensis]|uniref:LysR family transcriptional regulator n=1 Tax=Paracoccus xiamenensis TaxID=2714901 RepID=UPI001408B1C2|nr:LysR family transcriptional regulator [Paracoccus xiamenensis]NHF72365.1 LysR family transcriptional regulator [Paracoccus xiamenensis]
MYDRRFVWNLDWNLLRTFMVIADRQGITAAANVLGVKQPTVSAALQRLEASMQVQLVARGPRQFDLTPAGRQLYQEAAAIFGAVAQLPDLIAENGDRLQGQVTVALASHVVSTHFDDLLSRFGLEHPGIGFALPVHESREVANMVRENRVTAGICLLDHPPEGLQTRVLFHEHFAIYCGAGHPGFGRVAIPAAELAEYETVSFQTETLDGPLRDVRLMRDRIGLKSHPRGLSSSLHELRRMIAAGLGIGALPVHIAADDVARGRLRRIEVPGGVARVPVHLVRHGGRRFSAAEAAFLAALDQMLDQVPETARDYG